MLCSRCVAKDVTVYKFRLKDTMCVYNEMKEKKIVFLFPIPVLKDMSKHINLLLFSLHVS
jgi:hypothetical protein